MENPIFTFATPSIISKVFTGDIPECQLSVITDTSYQDRENVDVIAHELAHSWSGNLVTNASWEHFWLNEGWTTYLERRVSLFVPQALSIYLILLTTDHVKDPSCGVSSNVSVLWIKLLILPADMVKPIDTSRPSLVGNLLRILWSILDMIIRLLS